MLLTLMYYMHIEIIFKITNQLKQNLTENSHIHVDWDSLYGRPERVLVMPHTAVSRQNALKTQKFEFTMFFLEQAHKLIRNEAARMLFAKTGGFGCSDCWYPWKRLKGDPIAACDSYISI